MTAVWIFSLPAGGLVYHQNCLFSDLKKTKNLSIPAYPHLTFDVILLKRSNLVFKSDIFYATWLTMCENIRLSSFHSIILKTDKKLLL